MKKIILIAFALCLSLALSLCVLAADDGVISKTKDGLTANMMLTAEGENVQLDVEVINESKDVWNVAVTLTLPEGFECNEADVTRPVNLDLMLNETKTLSYSIVNTFAIPETEAPVTTEVAEKSGCGAAVSFGVLLLCVLPVAIIFKKH